MDDLARLRMHAEEVRRLETRFAEDWLLRAVLALDLAIRRAALAVITGGEPGRSWKGAGTGPFGSWRKRAVGRGPVGRSDEGSG